MTAAMLGPFAIALAALSARQDPPAPAPAPVAVAPAAELVPGAIPAGTSEEAASLWRAVCKATSGESAQPKVTAFDLVFDGRARPAGRESHDFNAARFRFLEPGFVSTAFVTGKQRVRGPKGDFLIDGKTRAVTRLAGVELEQDRRELDDTLLVARTFVGLVDARSIRLRALAIASAPPGVTSPAFADRAKSLAWIAVASPDFDRATPAGAKPRQLRAWIGVDRADALPRLAVVAEETPAGTPLRETAMLVSLEKYRAMDGFHVPGEVRCYTADAASPTGAFATAPQLTLWLLEGTLRPKLAPADFEPPAR
jgi:hypothetical protein